MNQKQAATKSFGHWGYKSLLWGWLLLGLCLWAAPAHADEPVALNPVGALLPNGLGTASIAWGDGDGDGDLDLAVGNSPGPNELYLNEGGVLQPEPVWESNDNDSTQGLAWGDVDNDGDLDLTAGNATVWNGNEWVGGEDKIYLNVDGILQTEANWISDDNDSTQDLAWGDVDNDGDLDLAVGNLDGSKIYVNVGGGLQTEARWLFDDSYSNSVAWGDVDNDGDLDLAVGIWGDPNKVYLNSAGDFQPETYWTFGGDADLTENVAWGDVDNDGDLDLAVGNHGNSQVYVNEGGILQMEADWVSDSTPFVNRVAWGDVDNDGDLDLAVGAWGKNKVYLNLDGVLQRDTNNLWMSADNNFTSDIAWGDVDNDGDLDLTAGNRSSQGRIYLNETGALQTAADIPAEDAFGQSRSVAWGDVDNDSDLDLAASNNVYLNLGGVLQTEADWTSSDSAESVAWGDVDNDGDLDLAVGNNGPDKLYLNLGDVLQTEADWTSGDNDDTESVAWGDVDNDGDLDLAIGNNGPDKVYLNLGGVLQTEADWTSGDDDTRSVAWGDVDNDGDLDLAVGNNGPNKLYLNLGGVLQTEADNPWTSSDSDVTESIAWGDVDNDGDLDLAIGNFGRENMVYLNVGGALQTEVNWTSEDDHFTYSVAWGDVDNDGDLDLAAGNSNRDNKVYLNLDGILQTDMDQPWASGDDEWTFSVAWGDINNDGALDLAAGNTIGGESKIYLNKSRRDISHQDDPAYAIISRPGNTADAFFFSTPEILQATNISINYTLTDPEGDPAAKILPEFSPTGGGEWFPATPGSGGDGLTNLAASPTGTPHTFIWNAEADLIKSDNAVFRLRVQPSFSHSPILWPAQSSQSPPFRVAAPNLIRVVDEDGIPVAGAPVYANGQQIEQTVTGLSVTDSAGLLNPGPLTPGTLLVALALQEEHPTSRDMHDGWAYRTYLTNVAVDAVGTTETFVVNGPGEQRLVVRPDNTLIVFNILVSVEWNTAEAYLQDVALAMEQAAHFLYDVTDGQMTFGQVTIYDNAEHWTEADIQISTKNVIQPHAYIGGLFGEDKSSLIRVGRSWDGNTANQGNWSEESGFRTLVHEFGHYGLGLYDEYFGYEVVNGELGGRKEAYCSGPENRNPINGAMNFSLMDYHYTTSELADTSRWTAWCQETAQHLLNDGEADWQTVLRLYGDEQQRWRLISPDQRAGVGQVVPGPAALPAYLPFPTITYTNTASNPNPFTLQVCANGTPYVAGAWVTLVKSGGKAMDQGLTDELGGQLTILGAEPNDSLQVVSMDGMFSAARQVALVQTDGYLNLSAPGLNVSSQTPQPYLRLWPTTSNGVIDGMRLALQHTLPTDSLLYAVTGHDGVGLAAAIPYDSDSGQHAVQVAFIPAALAGHARVQGSHAGKLVQLNVDYRLQPVTNSRDHDLFSNDGNLKVYLEAGSLPRQQAYFLIASPWGLPGSPPEGLDIVGEAYEITAADNLTILERPAVLRLRYDTTASDAYVVDSLTIYRWNFESATWQALPSELDVEAQEVVTTISEVGLYTLLGTPIDSTTGTFGSSEASTICGSGGLMRSYLPVLFKN